MPKKKYFIIGHITDDVITVEGKENDPKHYLGGSVSYGAKTARELGYEAHIITKCKPEHPYMAKLKELGILVHCLPIRDSSKSGSITSFVNAYDAEGNRTQTINDIAERITVEDFPSIRDIIGPNSIIQIAPVVDEVDPQLFTLLKDLGFLVVTPQGFFREGKTGTVTRKVWKNIGCLLEAQLAVLSTEDLTFADGYHESLARQISNISAIFILTKQEEGSIIYQNGGEVFDIKAFKLTPDEEKDFTGTGDTFAAAFFIHYFENRNLYEAGVFASFYAAAKISGIEGSTKGVETVPGPETVRRFTYAHQERVQEYLKENGVSSSLEHFFLIQEKK